MQNVNNFEDAVEFIPLVFRELEIKILPKRAPKDVQGLYNIPTGIIKIGTSEETTIPVLWHETMHKLLFEGMNFDKESDFTKPFKATIQFDNIAKDLEKWLFSNIVFPDFNYAGSHLRIKREK